MGPQSLVINLHGPYAQCYEAGKIALLKNYMCHKLYADVNNQGRSNFLQFKISAINICCLPLDSRIYSWNDQCI